MDNGANELRREESDDFTADTVRHMNNDSHSARPQDMEESVYVSLLCVIAHVCHLLTLCLHMT